MRTVFDECLAAKPLDDVLWSSRGQPDFWTILQSCDPRVCLQPPATAEQIARLSQYAGGSLEDTLEEFLKHSNGLIFDFDAIVFPIDTIILETERMRKPDSYLPIDHLLFIGGLGDGDMFAFAKNKRGEWQSSVFWWEHETDSCYTCGLGIWDYVAKHVGWRIYGV